MTGLKELHLRRNQLTSLPEKIGLMTGLKKLDLRENQLSSLPEEIVTLTGLTSLDLRNNPLVKPRSPAVEAWIAGLEASGCDATGVDAARAGCIQISRLSHSEVVLMLPKLIERCGGSGEVRELILDTNLSSLPEEIVALTGLTFLNLRNNPLVKPQSPAIEAWIAGLKASGCDVSGVDVTSSGLASWIRSAPAVTLASVKKLDLSGNQLTALPEEIGLLTGLKELDLNENQLTSLPEEIGLLTGLEKLNLNNNPLVKPQSSAVEAWLTALEAGGCEEELCEEEAFIGGFFGGGDDDDGAW